MLQTCVQSHQASCLHLDFKNLPRRLLDVGTKDRSSSIKLISTNQITQKDTVNYITLSHCWGKKHNLLRTTTQNLAQHLREIPWIALCKTFKDSVRITRGLGIQYLWIDSICIVQDDISEWKSESTNMGNIYSNSFLTLAATGSASGSGGCLFSRYISYDNGKETKRRDVKIVSGSHNGIAFEVHARNAQGSAHRQLMNHKIDDMRSAPLLTRAWCFQERLMSVNSAFPL